MGTSQTPPSAALQGISASGGNEIPVDICALPGSCWKCGGATLPIVGVFVPDPVDGRRYLDFVDVAHRLAAVVPQAQLRALGIGPIKLRRSRAAPNGYLSNGCVHCDAIQGEFPLHEELAEFQSTGCELHELIVATLLLPRRA